MHQKVDIIGRLGSNPVLNKTPNGKAVCNLRVATEAKKGETVWYSVTLWEQTAEYCAKYARKGTLVLCVGRMRTELFKEVERLVLHPEPFGFRILADGVPKDDPLGLDS